MIVHLFTENTLLESAFSNIFKLLDWQYLSHHTEKFDPLSLDPVEDQIALLSAPFSSDLGRKIKLAVVRHPNLAVVLFLDTNSSLDLSDTLDLIRAIVPTNASEDQIKNILSLAAAGYVILPTQYPTATSKTCQETASSQTTAAQLTVRELQILQQITNGAANKQIARQLDISLNTVQVHNSSIFRKLSVDNRTQAAHAFQHNKMYLLLQTQNEDQKRQASGTMQ